MHRLSKPILMLATTNPEKAKDFYENTLQFTCIGDEPWALLFQVGDCLLFIQKVTEVTAPAYTALGWQVDNIEETIDELSSRNVTFEHYEQVPQNDLGIMIIPGQAKVAWFKDPDGHTLSLTES